MTLQCRRADRDAGRVRPGGGPAARDGRPLRGAARRGRPPGPRGDAAGSAPPASCRSRCARRPTATTRCRSASARRSRSPTSSGVMTQRLGDRARAQGPRDRVAARVTRPPSSPASPAASTRSSGSTSSRAAPRDAARVARLPQRLGQGLRRDVRVPRRRALRPDPRDRRDRDVPEPLLAQLAIGGRLVVPIGPPGKQRLRVIRRRKTDFAQEDGEDVTFVPLLGRFARPPRVIARRAVVRGRVQGVGLPLLRRARRRASSESRGWVRNLPGRRRSRRSRKARRRPSRATSSGCEQGPRMRRVDGVRRRGGRARGLRAPSRSRAMTDFRAFIRDVPDFPDARDPLPRRHAAARLGRRVRRGRRARWRSRSARRRPTRSSASRRAGFIFGAALARELAVGFVPARKPGKLPRRDRARLLRPRVRQGLPRGPRRRVPRRESGSSSWTTCSPPAARRRRPRSSSRTPGSGGRRRDRSSSSSARSRAARSSGGRPIARGPDAIITRLPTSTVRDTMAAEKILDRRRRRRHSADRPDDSGQRGLLRASPPATGARASRRRSSSSPT